MKRIALCLMLLVGCSKQSGTQSTPETMEIPAVEVSSLDSYQSQIISNAQTVVRMNPQDASAWGKLGQALQATEFYAGAARCYRRAIELNELDGTAARWRYLLGLLQIQDEPEAGLSNIMRAVTVMSETNDAPRLRLARALVERGRFAEATSHLEKLLTLDTNHPAARLEMARIKLVTEDPANVAEVLRPALTNSFTARPALLLLSQARQRLGDSPGAEALAQRARAMPEPFDWPDPYQREVQNLKGANQNLSDRANSLMVRGRLAEAENLLNELTQRDPENGEPLLLLGRLRIQQRRCEEAEMFLQRHLSLQTNSLQGFVQLGLARYCSGQWAAAAEAFRKATELKPDFAQAHFNLGLSLSGMKDSKEAIAAFQAALRINPADANAHGALAEEFLRTGDKSRAQQHAKAGLDIDAKQPKALKVLQALQ